MFLRANSSEGETRVASVLREFGSRTKMEEVMGDLARKAVCANLDAVRGPSCSPRGHFWRSPRRRWFAFFNDLFRARSSLSSSVNADPGNRRGRCSVRSAPPCPSHDRVRTWIHGWSDLGDDRRSSRARKKTNFLGRRSTWPPPAKSNCPLSRSRPPEAGSRGTAWPEEG